LRKSEFKKDQIRIYTENKSILKRIQDSSSTYNFRKFEEDEHKRTHFKKLRVQHMNRLFKVSPGFVDKKPTTSTNNKRKYNTKYNSYLFNSDVKHGESETNDDTKMNTGWESQQHLRIESTKQSRDDKSRDDKSLPRFKTLDDGTVDPTDDNVQQVLNSNPRMKRSKTPSTYFKHRKNKNGSKQILDPKNYYANLSEVEPGLHFRESSTQGLINYDPSSMLISRMTNFSSQVNIPSMKEATTPNLTK
jgi:hypothetical protein